MTARRVRRVVTASALGLLVLSGCIDPRLPSLTDAGPELNVPPVIDRRTLTIPPSPSPVELQLGCGIEPTFGNLIVDDADLPPTGLLTYRWAISVQVGDAPVVQRTLFSGRAPNTSPPPARLTVEPFTLTEDLLSAAVFDTQPVIDSGNTHLLEFFVTDGEFVLNEISEVVEGAGIDYLYWLVTFIKDDCDDIQ